MLHQNTVQGVDAFSDIERTLIQYMADNIDHATKSLDGSGVVHVMVEMMTFTPAISTFRIIPKYILGSIVYPNWVHS